VGILAVNVLPRFDGTASYEAHTHRAQLISALRLTQQRAMQQTDSADSYCHQLIFDNLVSRYGIPNRLDCSITVFTGQVPDWEPDATGFEVDNKYQVSFRIDDKNNPSAITFDSMGRPVGNEEILNDCSDADGCIINIQSSTETLQIKIESEGYIHAI
jgi:MSHA pilin protein MshC